jgi:decaprenylphospho-beta-D-erythro-pentofuranosid-2-ulose 2-reductase
MSENVIVMGATSGIGTALCHELARRGCSLVVAGRNQEELDRLAVDLRLRYQTHVEAERFEALNFAEHAACFDRSVARFSDGVQGVIVCFGDLAPEQETHASLELTRRIIDVNFTAAASMLAIAANYLEPRKAGYLAAISSVAGDRGRQSNYTYGAAKAGLSAYLAGLRNRLQPAGVHVLTIKPGFVDTAMTEGLVNPNSPLVAKPERVARDIDRAIRSRRDVLYTPWFWRPIMLIIRSIPERVFKRLKL